MIKHHDQGNLERGLFEDYNSKELGLIMGDSRQGTWQLELEAKNSHLDCK